MRDADTGPEYESAAARQIRHSPHTYAYTRAHALLADTHFALRTKLGKKTFNGGRA